MFQHHIGHQAVKQLTSTWAPISNQTSAKSIQLEPRSTNLAHVKMPHARLSAHYEFPLQVASLKSRLAWLFAKIHWHDETKAVCCSINFEAQYAAIPISGIVWRHCYRYLAVFQISKL